MKLSKLIKTDTALIVENYYSQLKIITKINIKKMSEELKRLIASRIIENGSTQLIVKSIRDKLEKRRKNG